MASVTVKNEYHHLWPNSILAPPSSSSSSSSSGSPSPYYQDYSTISNTMNSFNTLSPLSSYLMDDDSIASMSSLDNTSFHASTLTSSELELEDGASASPFMDFTSVAPPPPPPFSPTTSTCSNSIYAYTPQPEDKVLLHSVMKSRLESLETVLLGDDYDLSDDDSCTTGSPSHTNSLALLQDDTTHLPELQQQMPPPPPPPQSFTHPAPAQESLHTIRSFDFHQPTFASWTTSYSSMPRGWQEVPQDVPPAVCYGIPPAVVPAAYRTDDPQVMLVHMLVMCAHAVAEDDFQTTNVMLARLRHLTSPSGTPMERLATYFAEALAARTDYRADRLSMSSSLFRGLVSDKLLQSDDSTQTSMLEAFSTFYDYLPIGKFDHLTMNQVILDTVERDRAIHILDLQLWFGTQWPALLQALATRPGGPPRVRITAVGTSPADLRATGAKLRDCARTLRVHLDYHELHVTNLLDDFHAGRVELRPGETFIVNSLSQFHYLLAGESSPASPAESSTPSSESKFASFLRHIRALRPKVLVMAENDASHNSPHFLKRFGECLKYYSAVFDAMATCASSPAGRLKMERLFAAPKIRNIIACEGADRVERHESMSDWSKRLESGGFRSLALSQRAINQAKLLLRLYYTNGYTLHNEKGYLVLGWRNLPLNTVSAWRLG